MQTILHIKPSPAGVHWVSFVQAFCAACGADLNYKCHSKPRDLWIDGVLHKVVYCYYHCTRPGCKSTATRVARHPEVIRKKSYSRSTFTRVVFLKYKKKFSVKQILEELPFLKMTTCYQILKVFRAAARAQADERIAKKFPPGTKVRVSIDGMEPEKGQPCLYTIREVTSGVLLAAKFLSDASAEALHELVENVLSNYGLVLAGIISDRQKSIVAMRDKYYPRVPHQYCGVHFLKNVTKALSGADKSLQKDLRSEVRQLSVLKTIKEKERASAPDVTSREQKILSETRDAIRETVNKKKRTSSTSPGGIFSRTSTRSRGRSRS